MTNLPTWYSIALYRMAEIYRRLVYELQIFQPYPAFGSRSDCLCSETLYVVANHHFHLDSKQPLGLMNTENHTEVNLLSISSVERSAENVIPRLFGPRWIVYGLLDQVLLHDPKSMNWHLVLNKCVTVIPSSLALNGTTKAILLIRPLSEVYK